MKEQSYESQRPITPNESYPTPNPSDASMLKVNEKKAILEPTVNETPSMDQGSITEKQTDENKDKPTGSEKVKSKRKIRKGLEQLLEDANRYDPNCDYSLPTTYKRSGSTVHRNRGNIQYSTSNYSSEEETHHKPDTPAQTKQKPKRKKRRLIRASLLLERENGLVNKSLDSNSMIIEDKEGIPNDIKAKKTSKGARKMPTKGLEKKSQQEPLSNEITSIPSKPDIKHNLDSTSSKLTPQRGRKPKIQNNNESKSKLSASTKTGKHKKHISNNLPQVEESNNVEEEETTPGNAYLQTKRPGVNGEEDVSTFIDWDGVMFNITDTFFNIELLEKTNFFTGEITNSNVISNHHDLANEKIGKIGKRLHKGKRNTPTDILIKLKSPLFFNQVETFTVNFTKDVSRYNPMLEIGKIIEYVALVYLPEPYSTSMKVNIIPQLNEAYDTSNTKYFVQMVEQYNKFIVTVPRNEIIRHIKNLKQVPLSFIHDFLQIVYTRAIHPRASQLRHYEAFSNYVYGELLPSFLSKVYKQCNLNHSSTFLDLGSGVGNCVIQASLEYNCKLSAGCEIMKDASDLTECQYKELKERCKLMGLTLMPIKYFLRESFVGHKGVKEVLKDCDVLLINNFLFDMKLNKEVEKLLQDVKVGCKIISLKSLRAPGYAVDFYNTDNIMSRLKIERFKFDEDSVSWTHSGGEYYISTVLDVIDESLLDISNRFRRSRQPIKYSR